MNFDFSTSGQIIFGQGSIQRLAEVITGIGGYGMVVMGSHLDGNNPVEDNLISAGIPYTRTVVLREPTMDIIEAGAAEARDKKVDFIIAIGGGSVIDAGKAIGMLASNAGRVLDFVEVVGKGQRFTKPSLPVIAIPTTAGTGSEVTRNAVVSIPQHKVKASLRHPGMVPYKAIIDPGLMLDLPAGITSSTGMDALTQVIEPFTSAKSNPMVDSLCLPAIKMGIQSLPECYSTPHNLEAREKMAYVSLIGGIALTNAGLGAVHGFAAAIGGMKDIPHGAICASMLVPVLEANYLAIMERQPENPARDKYEILTKLLLPPGRRNVEELIKMLYQFTQEIGTPGLGKLGVRTEEYPQIVEKALNASSMKGNPIRLSAEELTNILHISA